MLKPLALALILTITSSSIFSADIPWNEILTPLNSKLLAPRESVKWLDNVALAMKEAQSENRPLFVTLRCLPCKQCSAFDKDVLEGGGELDPLLRQFVTVRLTSAKDLDLNLFPVEQFQDLDLSWWGYFLSPEGRIYGIFGGRDEISDATRISKPALIKTMSRILAHHYDPRRTDFQTQFNLDGPAPKLVDNDPTPQTLPGYESWHDKARGEAKNQACIHCHQVAEILRQPAIDEKKFDKKKDLQMWPLPENVGIVLDRDDGLRIKSIKPDSPAQKAGLKPNDILSEANDRLLFSQADFRGVLHCAPQTATTINLHVLRDEKPFATKIQTPDDWRKTVLDWRMSISQGNIGVGPGFFPLPASNDDRKKIGVAETEMCIKPFLGKTPQGAAVDAGLKSDQFLTAVDGKSPNLVGRAFLIWFRLNHDAGDTVTLTIKDAQGKPKDITYKLK